ncbi:unnamed protein product, partial [Laminaria digitata]
MTWTTIDGRVLAIDLPGAEMREFLERLRGMLLNEDVSELDMIELVFGEDNPLTSNASESPRGRSIDHKKLAAPEGLMMRDLLLRKQIARLGKTPEDVLAERHTMTIRQAAASAGVSVQSIIDAIDEEVIAGAMIHGVSMVTPSSVDAYILSRGGAPTQKGDMLAIQRGSRKGYNFGFTGDGEFTELSRKDHTIMGTYEDWSNLYLLTNIKAREPGAYDSIRFYHLVPSNEVTQISLDGHFWVRGAFNIEE